MDLPTLATEAARKGVQLLGTGDCLHPNWLAGLKELEERNGFFSLKRGEAGNSNTQFVLTVEVEDERRVHHLLILPSISKAEELYESFRTCSPDIDSDGRPSLRLSGEEIAEQAKDAEALIGPCHAFTPWTAVYAYHHSLKECYGEMVGDISFVELGLSADSSYADRIGELRALTFLTNSDAHSPHPIRLAREFNRFYVEDTGFAELKAAIQRRGGRKPVLNVGVPPQEGKYNESACIRCYTHFSLRDAITNRWRCECGGLIKKGVRDRVDELANCEGAHPEHRPPYVHLIPLAEIIGLALHKSPSSLAVKQSWEALLAAFGTEVNVLVDVPIADFYAARYNVDERVVEAIKAFRAGEIRVIPGGGGRYGVIDLKSKTSGEEQGRSEEIVLKEMSGRGQNRQLSLLDF
jgi:uncharacterized protein (TIGR00375 family)